MCELSSGLNVNSFLFRDQEFDDPDFDAVTFVARYRRVASLESLREQLQAYSNHVRKQLYAIINRDYKDFITITTKLDGLDTRTEMIVKPLYTIQMDISSLHNGISTSLHLIKDKIDQQKDILLHKSILQRVLQINANLDLARAAFASSDAIQPNESLRSKLYKKPSSLTKESFSRDLFVCSEYERAAIALQDCHTDIEGIIRDNQLAKILSPTLLTDLNKRYKETRESLLNQLKSHLEHYFSLASTTLVDVQDKSSLRCFLHCIRALTTLQELSVAETALRSAVIDPFVKNLITGGRVDGKGGRGSYSGLRTLFDEYLAYFKTFRLHLLIQSVEPSVKEVLVIKGVYLPLITLLHERCPAMLSVGITSVFSSCFRVVDSLIPALDNLFLVNNTASFWLQKEVQVFYAGWKMDLYSQLRTREVMVRLDKACEVEIRSFLSRLPSSSSLVNQLYLPKGSDDTSQSKLNIALSLSADAIQTLITTAEKEFALLQYHHEIYKVWVMESLILCHEQVVLRPLKAFFVGLLFRCVQRLALHISLLAQAPLSSSTALTPDVVVGGGEESFDSLRQNYLTVETAAAPPTAAAAGVTGVNAATAPTTVTLPSLSAEEIVLHLADLLQYSSFITAFLRPYLLNCMSSSVASTSAALDLADRSIQEGIMAPLSTLQVVTCDVITLRGL